MPCRNLSRLAHDRPLCGGFPISELPPDLVDVNVHPTKVEVRSATLSRLSLVLTACRERCAKRASRRACRLLLALPQLSTVLPTRERLLFPKSNFPGRPLESLRARDRRTRRPGNSPTPAPLPPARGLEREVGAEQANTVTIERPALSPTATGAEAPPQAGLWSLRPAPREIQLHNAYLISETEEGMLVIDQHALHERILFDQLKSRVRSGTLERQRLLIPEPVELLADQAARLLEQRAALAELGLEVEEFGGNTLLVTSYPAMLGQQPPAEILQAVADHLSAHDRTPNREQLLNDLLSLMACKAAVKAGDPLTPELIDELLAQRDLATDPHHCPPGRPTALLFSRHDLDRQFKRI